MEEVTINDTRIDPKVLLKWLSTLETIPSSTYTQYVNYFRHQIKDNKLTEEEKCLMAAYLYAIDVTPTVDGKNHGYAGKKGFLRNYYTSNFDNCSDEIQIQISTYINDMYKKSIERKRAEDEKEIR